MNPDNILVLVDSALRDAESALETVREHDPDGFHEIEFLVSEIITDLIKISDEAAADS